MCQLLILCFSVCVTVLCLDLQHSHAADRHWKIPANAPLLTRWAIQVNPRDPHPEYPRPQMVRSAWMSLNGIWEWSDAPAGGAPPVGKELEGSILVPFPIESALSGVMKNVDRLWYRRTVKIPARWHDQRVVLHFGAIDWESTVYVNGHLLGIHRGGYDPFAFDITDALNPDGPQEIIIGVFDPTDEGEQPRGKQVKKPGGIWYTPCTGIWQSVWMEPVPAAHILDVSLNPDSRQLRLSVSCVGAIPGDQIEATVMDGRRRVVKVAGPVNDTLTAGIPSPRLWSPASPFLYDLRIRLIRAGKSLDQVTSYFGMRTVEVARDERGTPRIMLNGEPLFQVGPLDQGFWPDGLYAAPTDEALRNDIIITRKLGFSMARKHVKVEPERWYYWADRLGLLVWQDMPSGNNTTLVGRQQFESELTRMVATHHNHPSIIMWVVFNEGWGQYDTDRLSLLVSRFDPTRLVNNASGWTDQGVGDVMDIHNYPPPKAPPVESRRAAVLGEFGGLGLAVPGHTWKKDHWGYQGMTDRAQLTRQYAEFLRTVYQLKDVSGLCAAVYTQTTDVEVECNGLLTYDREIVKPDIAVIASANRGDFSILPPPAITRVVLPTSFDEPQLWRYTTEAPPGRWMNPAYDDSTWRFGYGGFGKTRSAGGAVRTPWETQNLWLRRPVLLPGPGNDSLCLLLYHDDDAEVYINGIKALDAPGWTTEYRVYSIAAEARASMKEGENLLAIHCLQKTGGQYVDAGIFSVRRQTQGKSSSAAVRVNVVPVIIPSRRGGLYTSNRAPLVPSPLIKLPIGSITPHGWLRHFLELERDGMTGRLGEISPWLDRATSAWASRSGEGARGWEELPYWLKGYGDLGYVLNDDTIISRAREWIEAILSSQREDGWFGPGALLTSLRGKADMWPHMVVLNIMQSYYEYNHDPRVLPFMTGYFQWQNRLPAEDFGVGYWPKLRMGDNIESVYWLYNRTGEPWLLDLARKIHTGMARWDQDVINWHNVNIAQGFRAPAVYFMGGRDITLLLAAERNYRRVMDEYGQFPGGGFAADENARKGFVDPRQGFETCGIVEFMHSFEVLTKISGDPVWADRNEEIALNSFPAAMTPDLKGLRYLTCANQVQLDKETKSPGVQNGGTMFSYSPFEVYRCCQHNVAHGWPYYAEELWLATSDSGLCVSLYAPSEVSARVGNGTTVTIRAETDYPFGDTIRFRIVTPKRVTFPLYFRIPRWCQNPELTINGKAVGVPAAANSYIQISREWNDGDEILLTLEMGIRVRTWEKNNNAVSISYGPLSFSLLIKERWKKFGSNMEWPEWEVFPASKWNYGLELDRFAPASSCTLERGERPINENPFTAETAPLRIHLSARQIPGWEQDYLGMVGGLQQSPARTDQPRESVTLIPMGAARLRISSFPTVARGEEGHIWSPPAKPKPIDFQITVSYVNRYDSKDAVADGFEPANSRDDGIAKLTWWNHRGTPEWIQYDFPMPRTVSSVSVYWYDDGEDIRVPQSWRLLYKKGDRWLPVESSGEFGTQPDTFNTLRFAPVSVSGLRLEVQLQPEYCGGLLEWKFAR